jgi:hypothetical protein
MGWHQGNRKAQNEAIILSAMLLMGLPEEAATQFAKDLCEGDDEAALTAIKTIWDGGEVPPALMEKLRAARSQSDPQQDKAND